MLDGLSIQDMIGDKTTYILTLLIAAAFITGLFVSPVINPPRRETLTFTESVEKPATVTVQPPPITQTALSTVTLTVTETRLYNPVRGVPLRLEVRESGLFELSVVDGYKVVRDALNRTLVLVPRGMRPPHGIEGVVVYVPVEKVVLMSATHVALLERLRERKSDIIDRVVGIMWGNEYQWYFDEVRKRLEVGVIKDVGPSWNPSMEELLALKPDLVIIYTFPGSDIPARLDEQVIPYAVDNEYLETTALGRFEWIKFIATFFDMDREAYEIFGNVERDVNEVVNYVKSAEQPLVCWFMIYRGTVYVAGGRSFPANTLAMLNARYGFADTVSTGSITTNAEELLTRCRDADVVVYPTSFVSGLGDVLNELPELSTVRAFRTGRVYAYRDNIFQLGYYDTEGYILDLAAILHPELYKGHELRYFTRLAG
jgi:iron complex transport system substrate-binding protein